MKTLKYKKSFLLHYKPCVLSCRGSLTVQFLLGFVLILTFIMLFASITLTLTTSEITQYITYTTSRHLFLSSGDINLQEEAANDKYLSLRNHAHLKKLFSKKLFIIKNNLEFDNGLGINKRFQTNTDIPNLFYGAWTDFTPKILEVDTLWGSTEEKQSFFKTTIGSYLGREPSIQECQNFVQKRWDLIRQKHQSYGGQYISPHSKYKVFMDNGC